MPDTILPMYVCVPVSNSLYNELVLRIGSPYADVNSYIEHAIQTYLDRTADDEWSEAYEAWKESDAEREAFVKHYGPTDKGYYWTPLFLPNGTRISMLYGGETHEAEIRHEQIFMGDKTFSSPSLLASHIANGTSRNAWRDIRIKRPTDMEYRLADELRRSGGRK